MEPEAIVRDKRRVVGYGAGRPLVATLAECDLCLSYAVDDNPGMQGQEVVGVTIRSPDELLNEDREDVFVVVFAYSAKNILSIFHRLDGMGFRYGSQYVDCSVFQYTPTAARLADVLQAEPNHRTFFQARLLGLYGCTASLSYPLGTWVFGELASNNATSIEGDIAECGAYDGNNAFVSLLLYPEMGNKTYHVFDSFVGFPQLSPYDPPARAADFRDVDFRRVEDKLSNFPNVRIHKGFFRDTLDEVASRRFSLVYVDCDIYESARECCEFFYERMNPGGIMLFHDYWVPAAPLPGGYGAVFGGVRKAVDEFFADKREEVSAIFPGTSHGVVTKT